MVQEDDTLSGLLMSDMPPELLRFVKETVNSFVKFDLLRFFHENQFTYESVESMAHLINHDQNAIGVALEELAGQGILEGTAVGDTKLYSLTKNAPIRRLVQDFVAACEEKEFRVKLIFHIIRRMR
jgi:hypothetical protein